MERPVLDRRLDSETFRSFYYLKEELARFCRENGLPVSGGKAELTERIARYLDTGEASAAQGAGRKRPPAPEAITEERLIEPDFVCSEAHRAFFREKIGPGFTFNVAFQRWLKSSSGKTYADAIEAYHRIMAGKKLKKSTIGSQFEYNAYIRDFFADNKGKKLQDAIKCWKYKKRLQGHNRYEPSDLSALD